MTLDHCYCHHPPLWQSLARVWNTVVQTRARVIVVAGVAEILSNSGKGGEPRSRNLGPLDTLVGRKLVGRASPPLTHSVRRAPFERKL